MKDTYVAIAERLFAESEVQAGILDADEEIVRHAIAVHLTRIRHTIADEPTIGARTGLRRMMSRTLADLVTHLDVDIDDVESDARTQDQSLLLFFPA